MYGATISMRQPACLIILVDQSSSMNRCIAGTTIPRRMAAADSVNDLISEACLSSMTGVRGVRHVFDVGVLAYGVGEGGVQRMFGKDLVPINEIAELAKVSQQRFAPPLSWPDRREYQIVKWPIWLEPVAKGQAMMRAAFEWGLAAVRTWIDQHPSSFPPIVINITGGSFAGMSPASLASEIRELTTRDGNALVFNCQISDTEDMAIMYPGPSSAVNFKRRMHQLYEMSSILPYAMHETARYRGYGFDPGARGYLLNSDITSIFNFIEIGTRVARDL